MEMKLKKLLALSLALVMISGILVSCGKDQTPQGPFLMGPPRKK